MKLGNMFKKTNQKNYITLTNRKANVQNSGESSPEVPEGLMRKCNACRAVVLAESIIGNQYICPKCGNYFSVPARRRIEMLADEESFKEWDTGLTSGNPLHYKGYEDKVEALREKTGLDEAVTTGLARIGGHEVVLAVCDSHFMMASMGKVVGEKLTRAIEKATERKVPVIIVACSGGARMQEGIHSLMQMAKTSAALKRHHDAGQLYISVLTNPTTGGVTASFAMLGDIILAEPNALIGFAGPRVIEQTIGQKLPKGFQRSEFLLEHGFIDQIVEREHLKNRLEHLLSLHEKNPEAEQRLRNYKEVSESSENPDLNTREELSIAKKDEQIFAWDRVLASRKKETPVGTEDIEDLFSDFTELHGDRYFGDDPAIVGGIARFHGMPVTVIAQEKGRNTRENVLRNFAMPSPEGYRKALRLMKQAEKFHRPVICFVDTPGAFCGMEAEERGQGEAIARNLFEMSGLKTPVLSIVIGEGGSGGALAMAVADEVWMLENSIYSILSPEGFASILWKDSHKAKEAAAVMRLTAADLQKHGMVERVFEEPEDLTIETLPELTLKMDRCMKIFFRKQLAMTGDEIAEMRYRRFRAL